jgi:hypothetical protein
LVVATPTLLVVVAAGFLVVVVCGGRVVQSGPLDVS